MDRNVKCLALVCKSRAILTGKATHIDTRVKESRPVCINAKNSSLTNHTPRFH